MTTNDLARDEPILILHVEDELAHAELLARGFEDHPQPHEIRHVTTGEAALDYLLRRREYQDPESSPRPNVVLLDLRLPGLDGLEVLSRIKASEELKDLPVVILTTSKADADKLEAYSDGIDGYIVKPLTLDGFGILLNVIAMVLRR